MCGQCPATRPRSGGSISYLRSSGITMHMATMLRSRWMRSRWRWLKRSELPSGQREKMKPRVKIVTVFGSSRPLESNNEYTIARELGNELAKKGFSICNGGGGGERGDGLKGGHQAGGGGRGV